MFLALSRLRLYIAGTTTEDSSPMKRIVLAAMSTLALGGCLHEAALDRHLYDRVAQLHGTQVAPLTVSPAPLIDPSAQPAPPMRDPNAPEQSMPAELSDKPYTPSSTPPG
jgi:hypothetical protein